MPLPQTSVFVVKSSYVKDDNPWCLEPIPDFAVPHFVTFLLEWYNSNEEEMIYVFLRVLYFASLSHRDKK